MHSHPLLVVPTPESSDIPLHIKVSETTKQQRWDMRELLVSSYFAPGDEKSPGLGAE
jgi:hypothetical protein